MHPTENRVPKRELKDRIRRLQRILSAKGIDGALIVQNTDLFYFAGTIQQSHLFIPADGPALLMVRKDLERARHESSIERIVPVNGPREIPEILRHHGHARPEVLGLECDVLPTNRYLAYREIFQKSRLADVSTEIRTVRSIKSDFEIALIRRACRLSDELTGAMAEFLQEGMTEVELAGRVEARARRLGHPGLVRMRLWGSELFYGHLMAGPAAAVPSYLASPTGGAAVHPSMAQGPSLRPIGRNEPVLLDYVFVHGGYMADQTRIFALGKPDDELVAAHAAMIDLHEELRQMARPGVACGQLYHRALERCTDWGYADNFMGVGPQRIRFVGHGVGLELDEFPFLAQGQKMPLAPGMVLAFEPKLIFPGKGVVGIENTLLVTENGAEVLTCSPEPIQVL